MLGYPIRLYSCGNLVKMGNFPCNQKNREILVRCSFTLLDSIEAGKESKWPIFHVMRQIERFWLDVGSLNETL